MSKIEVDTIEPQSGTTVTLGASGDTITIPSGATLDGSSATLTGFSGIFETQLLHVRDEKSNGSTGGTSASASFNIRDLNTVLTNEISGASLSSNKITLPSGTYYVDASAPGYECNMHRIFLYNESDGSNILFGGSATSDGGQGSHAFVSGRFTLGASKNIELRHYTTAAKAGDGLGRNVSQGTNEIFAVVKIWKVA